MIPNNYNKNSVVFEFYSTNCGKFEGIYVLFISFHKYYRFLHTTINVSK